jgi:hypothetical protein
MTRLPVNTPKTILTLSAEPELLPEDARSAAYIERQLDLLARVEQGHQYRQRRKRLTDELIEHVWPEAALRDERDPLTHQLQRELAPISESELRALWGDR